MRLYGLAGFCKRETPGKFETVTKVYYALANNRQEAKGAAMDPFVREFHPKDGWHCHNLDSCVLIPPDIIRALSAEIEMIGDDEYLDEVPGEFNEVDFDAL